MSDWTERSIEKLRQMWRDGRSATLIAEELVVT
jgi:hypothetical protein